MTIIKTSLKDKFQALCEARALLWAEGEYEFQDAADGCQQWAVVNKLVDECGQDEVQLVIARAFAARRNDLGGWIP